MIIGEKKIIMSRKKLTPKEIKVMVQLLKKAYSPFPYTVFIALCKIVPMIAIDVAIMLDKNRVLLTHRKDDFYNGWHIPGSILRYKESPNDAIKRVCQKELSLKISKPCFASFFNIHDIRGHVITLLYTARPINKPKQGLYFKVGEPPRGFLMVQKKEFEYLNKRK